MACTDAGEVFTWGDNDEGQVIIPYPVQRNTVSAQLGDGTTNAIQRPRLVGSLQNRKINRVACGSGNDSISGHSLILFPVSAHAGVEHQRAGEHEQAARRHPPGVRPAAVIMIMIMMMMMMMMMIRELGPAILRNRLVLLHHFR